MMQTPLLKFLQIYQGLHLGMFLKILRRDTISNVQRVKISCRRRRFRSLDYDQTKTTEQILANTNVLESINIDEEAMQFYLDDSNDELWKVVFRDKSKAILAVKAEGKNGNKYHDTVVETFLSEYEGTQEIKIPGSNSFPSDSKNDADDMLHIKSRLSRILQISLGLGQGKRYQRC